MMNVFSRAGQDRKGWGGKDRVGKAHHSRFYLFHHAFYSF
jgi:hypothetical protein